MPKPMKTYLGPGHLEGLQVPVNRPGLHSSSSASSAADFPSFEVSKVWMVRHCLPNWSPLAIFVPPY
jgi:hypothetical protein